MFEGGEHEKEDSCEKVVHSNWPHFDTYLMNTIGEVDQKLSTVAGIAAVR